MCLPLYYSLSSDAEHGVPNVLKAAVKPFLLIDYSSDL